MAQATVTRPNRSRPAQPKQSQRRYLKSVIRQAAAGDDNQLQTLLRPFLTDREELLKWGIASRTGVIPRYDFYFLTDRRVGDIEIVPLTGSFNVEVAYLQKIDAIVVRQPAIVLLRIAVALLYLSAIISGVAGVLRGLNLEDNAMLGLSLAGSATALLLIHFVIAPALKRIVLRFLKSGMFFKLTGGASGTFILADRAKMNEMLGLSSEIAEIKRNLDLEAN